MTISLTPAKQDLVIVAGDDVSIAITVTENGSAYSFTGATVTTGILSNGTAHATNWTQAIASNVLTLSLTDTNTSALGVGTFTWYVQVTKAGDTRTWIAGGLSVHSKDDGSSNTTSSATLAITDDSISLALTVNGQTLEGDWWYGQQIDGVATLPRHLAVNGTANTMTSQLLRLGYFTANLSKTVTTARVAAGATAAGATPTLIRIGLWTADATGELLALVASTTSDTTLLATQNTLYSKALGASYAVVRGQRYAAGMLVVTGATAPTLVGATPGSSTNAFTAISPRLSATVAAQADLPATLAAGSLTDTTAIPYIDFT